jgi:hypothetical protein
VDVLRLYYHGRAFIGVCGLRSTRSVRFTHLEQVRAVILLRYPLEHCGRFTRSSTTDIFPPAHSQQHRPRRTIFSNAKLAWPNRRATSAACYCILDHHDISFTFSPLLLLFPVCFGSSWFSPPSSINTHPVRERHTQKSISSGTLRRQMLNLLWQKCPQQWDTFSH